MGAAGAAAAHHAMQLSFLLMLLHILVHILVTDILKTSNRVSIFSLRAAFRIVDIAPYSCPYTRYTQKGKSAINLFC